MKIFLLLLCLLPLSACSTRDYDTAGQGILSESEIREQYAIDREWWKLYRNETLDHLVALALERNTDLARSAVRVNQALYRARQLKADLVPSFSGSGEASSSLQTDSGDSTRRFDASLGLNYELDLWGRLRSSASAQAWEYRATEEDREATRLALVNSVVNTYFSMARTRQELTLSRENLNFYKRLYALTSAKFRAGKIDGLDPAQAEQRLQQQHSSLLALEDQLREEEQTLRDLLDLRPEDGLDTSAPDLLSVSVPPVDLNVPLAALGARPDVKAAEFRVKSGWKDYRAARESLFPTLTVGGALGVSSPSSGTLFTTPFLNGFINLSLPFLDWNRVKCDVRISEEAFNDSLLAFRQALTKALNEVALYRGLLGTAFQQLTTAEKTYAAGQRVEAYRKARYELGADELKDWLDALQVRNSARLSVLDAKYALIADTNAVFQAMGGRIHAGN
ncbi:TolC family protein [uncultured Mailhella sp.]|uniref:TolC family protein n=1 Tax=uncultured Mailhella sp. TaxID=1981031 RepID=UPI00260420B8|nr:TolC family protein [uncultured Mailhella sp.]